eukprot:GHVS01014786.1.p1 GENE.GHVS01014786.1~~GHVS01014786.1.p1  ORF type:complete len:179 (-),score=64.93 GHVS01014786.1:250-786(-)
MFSLTLTIFALLTNFLSSFVPSNISWFCRQQTFTLKKQKLFKKSTLTRNVFGRQNLGLGGAETTKVNLVGKLYASRISNFSFPSTTHMLSSVAVVVSAVVVNAVVVVVSAVVVNVVVVVVSAVVVNVVVVNVVVVNVVVVNAVVVDSAVVVNVVVANAVVVVSAVVVCIIVFPTNSVR